MTKKEKFIIWTPRILSILLLIFLSLFSLDMIEPGKSIWEILGGMLIHNIPVFILLIILIISWKRPIVGGTVFTLAGLWFFITTIISAITHPPFEWFNITGSLVIIIPTIIIGILFLYNHFKKNNQTL